MTDKLNWGILGTGSIARTFAKAVNESPGATLVGVGSRTQESADKFGDEFNVPHRHATYEAFLADPDIQAVYISTPHPLHAQWAIRAADAGKHILCEKPLTLNHPEAMSVAEAARRNNVFLMEAFMYRCHPQTHKLVELIRGGAIGKVRQIYASFSFHGHYDPNSRLLNRALGGGGILDVGCYTVSMARLVAGVAMGKEFAEPLEVFAAGRLHPETQTDAYAAALLKFDGDILAQISTGVQLNGDNIVRIFGDEGHIIVPAPWFCTPTDGQIKILVHPKSGEAREEIIEAPQSLYAIEAEAFAEGVRSGRAPHPAMSVEDTLGNMATLDRWRSAIGLSYDEEKPELPLPPRFAPLKKRADSNAKYARIAGLDKDVSRLVMGTMLEGATFKLPQACALFDDFVERGGNCFDTAHVYGSEKIVGNWLASRGVREELVLIGKGAHPPACSPEGITRELLETLDNLQTDYVDIYMMHRDNVRIPVGEFVEVLNEHLKAGRVRAFGGSNWSLTRLAEANAYAREKGLQEFSCASNNFSLARMVDPVWNDCISSSDADSRAWFEETQMALFSWSSQARGFFVRGDKNFTADEELVRCWYADDNFERLARVQQLAKERDTSPINLALAYVLAQKFPTFALIGPRTIDEMRSSFEGLNVSLSPEEMRHLNLED